MTTKTNTFSFAGMELRCVTIDGQPWFVAQDAAFMAGSSTAAQFCRGVPEEQKGIHILDTPGGPQKFLMLSEGGLYSAMLRARRKNETVRHIQDWVTGTVLPAIRKDGMYLRGEEKLDLTKDADLAMMTMAVMEALKKKVEDAEARAKQETTRADSST